MNRFLFIIFILLIQSSFGWTWNYNKVFEANRLKSAQNVEFLQYTPSFTQLLISFNSIRPISGKFDFYVQVFIKGKGWSTPYKVMEWGRGKQKSFFADSEEIGSPKNHYVRFEIPSGYLASAFKVLVKPSRRNILHNLKSLSVCVSNYDLFESDVRAAKKIDLPSVFIRGVPKQSQLELNHKDSASICSPTSMAMVLSYLLKKRISFEKFADRVFDDGLKVHGSWPFNVAAAFEIDKKHNFRVERQPSFKALHRYLLKGYPVVVSVRGELRGAPKSYPHGHLLVVVGWDNKAKKVLVHDPAFPATKKVFVKYRIDDFLAAWEKSYYLSYVTDGWQNE